MGLYGRLGLVVFPFCCLFGLDEVGRDEVAYPRRQRAQVSGPIVFHRDRHSHSDLDFTSPKAPIPLGEHFAAAVDRDGHDRRLGFYGEQEAAAFERQQPSVRAARAFREKHDGNAAGQSLFRFL